MEVGAEGDYIYHYTVTTKMTSALRWAAMRAILMFHDCEGQRHKTVHRPQLLKRKESRSRFEPRSSAYQPNALRPGQSGSHDIAADSRCIILSCFLRQSVGHCRHRDGGGGVGVRID